MDQSTPRESVRSQLYLEREELLERIGTQPLGEVVTLSFRSPIKSGPNEDGALLILLGERRAVLAVADGVGGQPSAQLASRLALQTIEGAVLAAHEAAGSIREAILTGIEDANHAIVSAGAGSATTLAAVELCDGRLRSYHVGDSRVLLFDSAGRCRLETIAHSPVGYAIEAGVLDEEQAIDHEQRHLVSNVIGDPNMHVEMSSAVPLGPNDTLIAATDGLFDNMHVAELVERMRQGPLEAGVRALAAECHGRMMEPGGELPSKPDDLTLIAFRPGRA